MNEHLNIAFLSGLLLLGGCINLKENISHNPAYHTDYVAGAAYRTKQLLFIQVLDRHNVLRMAGDGDARIPPTVESYWRKGREDWPEIIGVIEAGTKLRINRIIRTYNGETGNTFYVLAHILNGASRGFQVDLSMVSLEYRQKDPVADVPIINPDVLEEVKE